MLVKVRVGESIRSLLSEQFGLTQEYVKNRIQTAFLNGKPVDDFDTAVVGEGSVLTLSGALPGLAGATLRKGGFFSSLRASLSYQKNPGRRRESRDSSRFEFSTSFSRNWLRFSFPTASSFPRRIYRLIAGAGAKGAGGLPEKR